MITASTHPHEGGDTVKNEVGIPYAHAYTVLGVQELSNGQRLVKLRNPWGRDSYTGDWSDNSNLWTDTLRSEVGVARDKSDGIIFMPIEDYMNHNFIQTSVNKNVENLIQSYFLVIDDKGSRTKGKYQWCGSKC